VGHHSAAVTAVVSSIGHSPASRAGVRNSTSSPADRATAARARNSAARSAVIAMRTLPVWRQSAGYPVSCSMRAYSATDAIASRHRSLVARTCPTSPAACPDVAPASSPCSTTWMSR